MSEAERGRIPVFAQDSNPWVLNSHSVKINMTPKGLEPCKIYSEARVLPWRYSILEDMPLENVEKILQIRLH